MRGNKLRRSRVKKSPRKRPAPRSIWQRRCRQRPKTTPRSKPREPAPQKPDIRLPPDAIRASKAGTKPLSEHIRKHEEKKKRDDLAAKKGPSRPGSPAAGPGVLGPLELPSGKDRPRRGGVRTAGADDEERKGLGTLGGREQRQLKRKRPSTGKRGDDDDSSGSSLRKSRIQRKECEVTPRLREREELLSRPRSQSAHWPKRLGSRPAKSRASS